MPLIGYSITLGRNKEFIARKNNPAVRPLERVRRQHDLLCEVR